MFCTYTVDLFPQSKSKMNCPIIAAFGTRKNVNPFIYRRQFIQVRSHGSRFYTHQKDILSPSIIFFQSTERSRLRKWFDASFSQKRNYRLRIESCRTKESLLEHSVWRRSTRTRIPKIGARKTERYVHSLYRV